MPADYGMERSMRQVQYLSQQARITVHILQLPLLELREYLARELTENPMLEGDEGERDRENVEDIESAKEYDFITRRSGVYDEEREEKRRYREAQITKEETLEDHLLWQLDMSTEEIDHGIGEEIIGDLDRNGYLRSDTRRIAEKFYVPLEKVEEILFLIQGLHPAGVGARDLRECLLAQLRSQGKEDTLGYRIVETCLKDLEKGDDASLAKKLRVKQEDVVKARQLINSLEPKPGRMFAPGESVWAVPDIIIERKDDRFSVSLNERFLPKLRLSSYYLKLLKGKNADDDVKGFLEERKTRAQWVIEAILQRRDTIKKVAEYIVNVQKDFLDDPWGSVKPLKMEEIAEDLGVSKSTVSRAVAKKYVQTEYGLLPLKRFFSTALAGEKGEDLSADLVKKKIGEMIADEDKRTPLSDADIAGRLEKDGINIARRTVAKYREGLGIAARGRRRKKRKG